MFKLLNDSHDTFAKIYARFSKPLLNYIRSRISDAAVAEELVQEVFLKAYRFRGSYQERYALSTWLWTIARNTVSDHLRGARPAEPAGVPTEELPCERPCAESIIIRKGERRDLLKMMRRLTRLQKRVLWLRVIHQLSYEEISKNLGVSLSAVKNLAYRAKLSLAEGLSGGPAPVFAGL